MRRISFSCTNSMINTKMLPFFQCESFHKLCIDFRKIKYISIENLLQNKQVDLPLKFNYFTVLLFKLAQILFHITEYMASGKIIYI